MGINFIFLDKARIHFEEVVLDLDVSSRPAMREELLAYIERNTYEVLLVDCNAFQYKDFSLFLKVLEDLTFRGSIWFYNAPITKYPTTVRSRCHIVRSTSRLEFIRGFLQDIGAYTQDNLTAMIYLQRYPVCTAWAMLEDKSKFMSFIIELNQATPGNFYLTMKGLTEDKTKTWLYLLYEWLAECSLFSETELELCHWMRTEKFKKVLDRLLFEGGGTEKHIFEFLMVYGLIEVVK